MRRRSWLGPLLWATLCACSVSAGETSNPLGKVIQLISDFQAKIAKEGGEADKAYSEYSEWCDDVAQNEREEINTSTSKKEKLESSVGKLQAAVSVCDTKIDELVKSTATSTKDLRDATDIRNKEAEEFASNEAELMDTIDTLKRAISIVSKEMKKNAAALAQVNTTTFDAVLQSLGAIVDAASFSVAGKDKLMSLVQSAQQAQSDDAEEDEDSGAPDAQAYKSHSTGIIDLMEDLQEKAEDDLAELRQAEGKGKQNYQMLKQSLEDSMNNGDKDMADEKAEKAAAEEEIAKNQKDLAISEKALKAAQDSLEHIKAECMQVAADHEVSKSSRKEELRVLEEAKKTLQETTGGAEEEQYSFVQVSARSGSEKKRSEVLSVVQRLSKRFRSRTLAQLASKISAVLKLGGSSSEDPFVKIKGMLESLIARLEAEGSAAAEEKAYCDDEMKKTEEKKSELEQDLESLTAKMDKASSSSVMLKNEVRALQMEMAKVTKLQADMDNVRREQNTQFTRAKGTLEEGLEGVRRALEILRDYYGSKDEGADLLQTETSSDLGEMMKQPAKPVMHQKEEGAGSGIIGILQICESDFAKNIANIEEEEEDSQSNYEKTTQDNKVTMTEKRQDMIYKVQEFKSLDKGLADMAADKETMDSQLKAVLEYYTKVKDRCVAKPESYEERAKKREEEVAGLKEALSVLDSETALVQVRSRRTRPTGALSPDADQ